MGIFKGTGDKHRKLLSEGGMVPGKITEVKKCWWIKVNTKPVRSHALDGAEFPHIIKFVYIVDGIEYNGRQLISYKIAPPSVGEELEVYYDKENPSRNAVKMYG